MDGHVRQQKVMLRKWQRNNRGNMVTSWKTRGKLERSCQLTKGGGASRGQEAAAVRQEASPKPAGKQEAKGGEAPAGKEAAVS